MDDILLVRIPIPRGFDKEERRFLDALIRETNISFGHAARMITGQEDGKASKLDMWFWA